MALDSYTEVKDDLINRLLVILAIIVFPAIIVSLLRTAQMGWQPALLIQAGLVPVVVLLAVFRKSFSLKAKAIFLILLCFSVAVPGLVQFSLSSAAIQYLMMGVLAAVVFLGNRTALWVYLISAAALITFGILITGGIIRQSVDLETYNSLVSTWANNTVTFLTILGLMIILVGNIGRLLNSKLMDLKRKNEELERALSEIKTLRGIIPICSYCKKVRNDSGYWDQVDIYIRNHSEADFSHGICPDCARVHFAGFVPDRKDFES